MSTNFTDPKQIYLSSIYWRFVSIESNRYFFRGEGRRNTHERDGAIWSVSGSRSSATWSCAQNVREVHNVRCEKGRQRELHMLWTTSRPQLVKTFFVPFSSHTCVIRCPSFCNKTFIFFVPVSFVSSLQRW